MFASDIKERRSPTALGEDYQTILVVSGSEEQLDLRITQQARDGLRAGGWNALRQSGLWETETDVLEDQCPLGERSEIEAVLFVWHNRLKLRECSSHVVVYEIRSTYAGSEKLLEHLKNFLRGRSPV